MKRRYAIEVVTKLKFPTMYYPLVKHGWLWWGYMRNSVNHEISFGSMDDALEHIQNKENNRQDMIDMEKANRITSKSIQEVTDKIKMAEE